MRERKDKDEGKEEGRKKEEEEEDGVLEEKTRQGRERS